MKREARDYFDNVRFPRGQGERTRGLSRRDITRIAQRFNACHYPDFLER
jgi:hypothetical protein